MKKLEDLYNQLKEYSNFDIERNPDRFLQTVDKIVLMNDPSCIDELVKYFDDKSNYSWVLESLMIALEYFEDNLFVKKILKNIFLLNNQASNWAKTIMYGIINNPKCLNALRDNIESGDKNSLMHLLNTIEFESPYHRELIKELKMKLNKID
jgi:hypothetical protein